MANTINTQTLLDGEKNVVIAVYIEGDGSGDETATQLVDFSSLASGGTELKMMAITANLSGFAVTLLWDATTDVNFWQLSEGDSFAIFDEYGGLINNAGAGKTGDINITTANLGNGDKGTMVLEMRKRG